MKRPLIALASLLLLLSACGSETPGDTDHVVEPQAALMAGIAKTYDQSSMHVDFEFSASAGEQSFSFTGAEDVDLTTGAVHMTMDMGMLGGTMEMLSTDGRVVYLRSPMFRDALGVDTEWVSMDSQAMAAGPASLGGVGSSQMDPSAMIGLFAGAVRVERAGREPVADVATTRYEGTIDLAKVLEGFAEIANDEANEEHVRRSLQQMRAFGLGELPFQAWIDDDGLLRKLTFTMTLSAVPGAPDGAEMVMEATFSYDVPVDIRPPRPAQVTDVTEQLAAAGAASGSSG